MADAWIYASDADAIGEVLSVLAELGFSPRQIRPDGPLRPPHQDAADTARPDLTLVIGAAGEPSPTEVCERLKLDEILGDVPLVLAVQPEHVSAAASLARAPELLVAPFGREELGARIALARRRINGVEEGEIVRAGSLELNLATYQATSEGEPIELTYMEYQLLKFLMTHSGRVFPREALLSRVWGYDYYGGARTVDVHVRRVRAKIGPHASRLKTIRGVGYRFER